MHTDNIREQMKVVGSDGQHIGTVDKVENDQIKLTKNDSPDGQHHYISLDSVETVEENEVRLSVSASEAQASASGGASM